MKRQEIKRTNNSDFSNGISCPCGAEVKILTRRVCGFAMINLSLNHGKNIHPLCTLRTRRTGREGKI